MQVVACSRCACYCASRNRKSVLAHLGTSGFYPSIPTLDNSATNRWGQRIGNSPTSSRTVRAPRSMWKTRTRTQLYVYLLVFFVLVLFALLSRGFTDHRLVETAILSAPSLPLTRFHVALRRVRYLECEERPKDGSSPDICLTWVPSKQESNDSIYVSP